MQLHIALLVLIGVLSCGSEPVVVPGPHPGDDYKLSPENKLYKLHPGPLTWASAARACESEGARLAVMESEVASTFLTKLMLEGLANMDSPVALLGYSRGSGRQFITISGKPLDATGFTRMSHSGPEMMGLKGGNCGSLHRDGGISRFPCQTPAPFLCEKLNDTTPAAIASSTSRPPLSFAAEGLSSRQDLGYVLLDGLGWYKVHGDNKKWHDAVTACEAEGAHLAVINSAEEANALKMLMTRQRGVNYGVCHCALIGFHDLSREGHFITVFGQPLESTGFTKWGPGNPDNSGNNEDCGSLTYRGDLNDLSCLEPYPFICEHSTNSVSYDSDATANATTYQPAYENYPGVGTYKLHTEGRRWTDALEVCEAEDAYLAVINNALESDVIRKLLGRSPDLDLADGKAVFIGFEDDLKNGNFTTVLGDPLDTGGFLHWAENSPSGPGTNAHCGGFDRSGGLVNVDCSLRAPFVCEKRSVSDPQIAVLKPLTETVRDERTQEKIIVSPYVLDPGLGFYRLSLQPATWSQANQMCDDEDGHLAVINSEQESQLLQNLISRSDLDSSVFLGFHDQTREGSFETVLGGPLETTGYTKWAAFSPDNFGHGQDCGAMDPEGYLEDFSCDVKLPFICERELNYTITRHAYNATDRLTVSPEHIHVKDGDRVVVKCNSEEPLVECQFKASNGPLIDLSLGRLTRIDPTLLNRDITHYSYTGSGLLQGHCGMSFNLSPGLHRIMMGCRTRSLHGGWKYGYMSVQASNADALSNIRPPPSEVLVRNSTGPLRLVWQANTPISVCKCILPSQFSETRFEDPFDDSAISASMDSYDEEEDDLFFGDLSPVVTSATSVSYHGLGFQAGQCGVELAKPREWAGYLWCGMGVNKSWEWRATAIIVDKPPPAPELVIHAVEHSEGAILEAECLVGPSRPVSNITWYLGDDVIRQDSLDDSPSVSWAWPSDEQTITQKLTRQVKAGDRGKELTCEAGHFALPAGTLRTSRVINIEGLLLNRTFDVEEFGFVAGKPGFISIVITASPMPEVTWHFDNVTIKGGGQDPSGRFVAAAPTKMNSLSIHWVAKLFISNVTDEDFTRDFHLTAKNEFGAQAYKVVMVRAKTTVAPPTTSPTTTPTTTTTQRRTTREDTSAATSSVDTTAGYTEYFDPSASTAEPPLYKGSVVAPEDKGSWATSGAIAGIVVAILLVHLMLAAIIIYGRRSGWQCLPLKARRRFLPSMSMDNLMNEGH